MSKVHLLGQLSQFGEVWEVSETKVSSIFKLIECQRDDFKPFLTKALDAGLDLAIVSASGLELEEPMELFMENLMQEDMYVALVPAGSGKGWGKLLAGVFIAIASYFTFGAAAAAAGAGTASAGAGAGALSFAANIGYSIGVSLALQGVTQLLTKIPGTKQEEEGPGVFDGPINTIKAGQPIPVLYGELLVGGAPIHVNIGPQQSIRRALPSANFPNSSGASYAPSTNSPYTSAVTGTTEGSGDATPPIQSVDFSQIEFDWTTINLGELNFNINLNI